LAEARYYVRGSYRQRGHLRKRRYDLDTPTQAQRKARAILAQTAFEKGRGKKGTVEVEADGEVKEMPASALAVKEELKGKPVAPPKPSEVPPDMLPYLQLKRAFEALAKVL